MTVSELTVKIRGALEPQFAHVDVDGEISNLHNASSGHVYFTLKDASAMIQAVSFNHSKGYRGAALAEGMQVHVGGRVTVYAQRGNYQIICSRIEEIGSGALLAMVEARKKMLAAEGLFSAEHKQAIPRFVRSVALLTSPRGAAVRDFLEVTRRRNNGVDIIVVPCAVQGAAAATQICERLEYINHHQLADVIVMTRGGGSLEDLLPFSEERVVRAVYASRVPIVAAIGHEIDTALCELAADVRASTPSVAAELITVEKQVLLNRIAQRRTELEKAITKKVQFMRSTLVHYQPPRLRQMMIRLIGNMRMRIDSHRHTLQSVLTDLLRETRHRVQDYRARLHILSPATILQRGFAIVQEASSGAVVRDSATQSIGNALTVRVASGGMTVDVTDILPEEQ